MSFFKDENWKDLFSTCDNKYKVWLYLIKKVFQFGVLTILSSALSSVGISSVTLLLSALG